MRFSILSLLILLSACNSSSDDDKEDLTPLRGGLTVGGTNSAAFDGLPALAADAGQLVFISGRQITHDEAGNRGGSLQAFKINLTSEEKNALAVTDGSFGEEHLVTLSPNAEYYAIAAKKDSTESLILGALTRGDKQLVVEDEFKQINTLAVSDDSRFLALGFVDGNGKNKVRVYDLPASANSLNSNLDFSEVELDDETAGLNYLSFAPTSTYQLFMRTQGKIYRCDFVSLQASLCSPEKIYEAIEMTTGPNSMSLDSQYLSFFKQVSSGSSPVFIEEGHSSEKLFSTVALRSQLQRISLDGQTVDTPNTASLGFSGYILASSLTNLQVGVFNEMYYCKATGETINTASILKIFTPGSTEFERLILAQAADKSLSFVPDLCAPLPDGSKIIANGLERVIMNRSADTDEFVLAFQLSFGENREIYQYNHATKKITALAPNPAE